MPTHYFSNSGTGNQFVHSGTGNQFVHSGTGNMNISSGDGPVFTGRRPRGHGNQSFQPFHGDVFYNQSSGGERVQNEFFYSGSNARANQRRPQPAPEMSDSESDTQRVVEVLDDESDSDDDVPGMKKLAIDTPSESGAEEEDDDFPTSIKPEGHPAQQLAGGRPAPGKKAEVRGKFDPSNAYAFVPKVDSTLPSGTNRYTKKANLSLSVPIIVGTQQVYALPNNKLVVYAADRTNTEHEGLVLVPGRRSPITVDDFNAVPIAFVPKTDSGPWVPSMGVKPAGPCPAADSPFKPIKVGHFLAYYDGQNLLVYGESSEELSIEGDDIWMSVHGQSIDQTCFEAVKISK